MSTTETDQESRERGKYAIFSSESMKIVCEMSGYENLPKEILSSIASNATYRLQEIIEECALNMRNSKTSYLTTSIVNEIFVEKQLPKVYGYDGYLDEQPMELVAPAQLYTETDNILDINTLLGTYDEKFNENVLDGNQAEKPDDNLCHPDLEFYKFEVDNDADVDVDAVAGDVGRESDDYETGLHSNYIFPFNDVSTELNEINDEYYQIIIKNIFESSENVFLEMLNDFRNERNFGFLGNQFINFLLEQFVEYPYSAEITPRLLIFAECLLMNNFFHIHEIVILHLIKRICGNLLSDDLEPDNKNDPIRDRYAELLYAIIPRVDQRLNTITLITKQIADILHNCVLVQFPRKIIYSALTYILHLPETKLLQILTSNDNKLLTFLNEIIPIESDINLTEIFMKIFYKISNLIDTTFFYFQFGDKLLPWDKNLKNNENIILNKSNDPMRSYLNKDKYKIKIRKLKYVKQNESRSTYIIKKNWKVKISNRNSNQRKYIPNYSLNFYL